LAGLIASKGLAKEIWLCWLGAFDPSFSGVGVMDTRFLYWAEYPPRK
jgi:hypothetical protein